MLSNEYKLWCHDIVNTDWTLKSYLTLCVINNVSEFWKLFNNMGKLNVKKNNLFLMKNDISPTWEDPNNRNGGICSFRIDINESVRLYEMLCVYLMCGQLIKNDDDINGVSLSPKNNWGIVKIWNKNKDNDISKLLHRDILTKYGSVMMYKQNQPEY